MRAVNLLPRQQVQRKRETPNAAVLVALIGGSAVVLALLAGFLLANRSVDRQRQALSNARAMLAATPAHHVSAKTNAFRSAVLSQRQERSLALAAAIGKRVAWDRILRRFALVLPSDVWLTSLTASVPLQSQTAPTTSTSVLPPEATALSIQGSTYTQEGVARLLERLAVVPDLKNVQLQNSVSSLSGGQKVINFTIVSDIRQGRGAS